MDLTPEMLNFRLKSKKETVKKVISDNEVKLSDNQISIAEIRNNRIKIESEHAEEMARIKQEENLALARIDAANEQEITKIKAKFACQYKEMDDAKQIKLARIFEKMFNTQLKMQDEKDIVLSNQVIQGILSFADKAEKTHEKNLEFINSQIDKYDKKIESSTGHDKSDARRQLDEWRDKFDKENKNFAKQQNALNESIMTSSQKYREGIIRLPDFVSAISNNNSQFGVTLGFNKIPEIKALEDLNEEN